MSSTNSRYLSVASGHIDSLISYVLDVKPYHVKLSEIVEEYLFNDTVNVKIADHQETLAFLGADILPAYSSQHNVRRRRATSWYKDLTSDGTRTIWQVPLTVINKLASKSDQAGLGFNTTRSLAQEPFIHGRTRSTTNVPPAYIDPLEAAVLGFNTNNVETDNDFQIPGIDTIHYVNDQPMRSGAFNPKRWSGPGVPTVTKNGTAQIDSVDYFLSHGAFSVDIRANMMWKELNLHDVSTFAPKSGALVYNKLIKTYGTIDKVELGNYEEWTITWIKPDNSTSAIIDIEGSQSGALLGGSWGSNMLLSSQLVYDNGVTIPVSNFAYGVVYFAGFKPDLLAANVWNVDTTLPLPVNVPSIYDLKLSATTATTLPACKVLSTALGVNYADANTVFYFKDGSSAQLKNTTDVIVSGTVNATLAAGTSITIHGGQTVILNSATDIVFNEVELVTSAAGIVTTYPVVIKHTMAQGKSVTLPDGTTHTLIAATAIDIAGGTVVTLAGYNAAQAAVRPVPVEIAHNIDILIPNGTIINPDFDYSYDNPKLVFHLFTNPSEYIDDGESFVITPSNKITVAPDAPLESWTLIKTNPITSGDREEHYLVYGSVSGWTPNLSLSATEQAKSVGAAIGEWYWNGKIGFKIPELKCFPKIQNATIISSALGDNNTWTTEVSNNQIIKNISFDPAVSNGKGAFFITGEESIAGTSSDGKTWVSDVGTTYSFDATNPFRVLSITGDNGKIYLSTPIPSVDSLGNPITVIKWIEQRVPTLGAINSITQIPNALRAHASDPSPTITCILAVGEQGIILSSVNGMGWQPCNSGTTENLTDVTWSPQNIVAIGDHGTIVRAISRNDVTGIITWAKQTYGPLNSNFTEFNLKSVIYVASLGKFIAVGEYGTILTSVDGTSWLNLGVFPAPQLPPLNSSDAVVSAYTAAMNALPSFTDVVFGNGKLVAVSANGIIATSTDGSIWTAYAGKSLNSIAYGNGVFVGVGGSRNEVEHLVPNPLKPSVNPLAEPSEYTITFYTQQTDTEEGLATVTNNVYGFRAGLVTNTLWDDGLVSFTLATTPSQTKYQTGDVVKIYLAPEYRYVDFAGYDETNYAISKYESDVALAEFSVPLLYNQELFPLYHSHGSVIFKDTLELNDSIVIDKASSDAFRLRIIGSGLAFPELAPVDDWIPLEIRTDVPFPGLVKYIYAYSSANPNLLILTIEQPQYNTEDINASALLKFEPAFVTQYLKFNTKFSLAFYPDESYGQKIRVKITEDYKIFSRFREEFFEGPLQGSYIWHWNYPTVIRYPLYDANDVPIVDAAGLPVYTYPRDAFGNLTYTAGYYSLVPATAANPYPFNLNISDAPIKHYDTGDKITFFDGPAIGYHFWEYITKYADPLRIPRNKITKDANGVFIEEPIDPVPNPIVWQGWGIKHVTDSGYDFYKQLTERVPPQPILWTQAEVDAIAAAEAIRQANDPLNETTAPKTYYWYNDTPQSPVKVLLPVAGSEKTVQDVTPIIQRTDHNGTVLGPLLTLNVDAAGTKTWTPTPNTDITPARTAEIETTWKLLYHTDPYPLNHEWYNTDTWPSKLINGVAHHKAFYVAITEGGALPLDDGFGYSPYQTIKNGVMKGLKKIVAPSYTAHPPISLADHLPQPATPDSLSPAQFAALAETITYSQQVFNPGTFLWSGNPADWTFPKVTAGPSIQVKQSYPSKPGYEYFPYGTSPLNEFPYNLPPYKNWQDKNGAPPAADTGISEASITEGLFITERAIDTRWLSGYDTTPYDVTWTNPIAAPGTIVLGYPYDTPLDYVAAKVNFTLDFKNIKTILTPGIHYGEQYMDIMPPQFTNLPSAVDEYMVTILNKTFTSTPTFTLQALVAAPGGGYMTTGPIENPATNLHNPFPELPDITSKNAYVFITSIPMPFRLTII